MSTFRPRPTLPAFALLTALLVTPALVFARPSVPQRQVRPAAAAASVGRLGHPLRSLRGETGMSIDPNGVASPSSGGSIDPNGAKSFRGDSGVSIDPNG